MTPLLLIRHGETTWNEENKIQGQSDIPLSDRGRAKVHTWCIPEEFSQFEWVSSPLRRARETALIMGHNPEIEDALREMSWGQWEGKNWTKLQRSLGKEAMLAYGADSLDFRPPEGESPHDLQARLLPWLRRLQKPTIAVCHKGILQAIYSISSGWRMTEKSPVKFEHGYAYLFQVRAGSPLIDRMKIPLALP